MCMLLALTGPYQVYSANATMQSMEWLILGFAAAVFNALKTLYTKKVSFQADHYTVAWVSGISVIPILWASAYISGFTSIDPRFWLVMAVMLPLEIVVTLLLFKAIKDSELSLSYPFVSFLPLFVAFWAFLILGEALKLQFILAILFLATGSYLINIEKFDRKNFLLPFRTLVSQSGPPLILIVTLIWGFLIPMGKLAVGFSSAQMFPAIYFTLAAILFTPVFLWKNTNGFAAIKADKNNFFFIAIFYGLFLVTSWLAYSKGPAALVNSLTELSILITVVLAGTFLKEKRLHTRLLATTIMLIGALLVIVDLPL